MRTVLVGVVAVGAALVCGGGQSVAAAPKRVWCLVA